MSAAEKRTRTSFAALHAIGVRAALGPTWLRRPGICLRACSVREGSRELGES